MLLSNELQEIISGTGKVTKGTAIQAVAHHLGKGKATGKSFEEKELIKKQEAEAIIEYAAINHFFFNDIQEERYLAEGAEQKVYLAEDNLHVLKLNDAVFYATWSDYFTSLLFHNHFFPLQPMSL